MAVTLDTYAPYDAGPGANVTEDGWRQFAQHWRGNGVIRNLGSSFAPFGDSSGMQVKVPVGECWIKGNWGNALATKILPVATAHATLTRLDRVILRNDFSANRIECDVLTGTAGSTSYPALTQNTSRWEIQLGLITVSPAVSTIAANKVVALQEFTDASCGYTVDSSYQTITDATSSWIDFDVSQFDSSGVDRPTIRQFTLTRAGMWLINFNLYWDTNASGSRSAWIQRATGSLTENFGAFLAFDKKSASPDGGTAHNISALERFTAGETVEMWGRHQSGSTRSVLGSPSNAQGTRVAFWWLGP